VQPKDVALIENAHLDNVTANLTNLARGW
jgi:hypothetical protein